MGGCCPNGSQTTDETLKNYDSQTTPKEQKSPSGKDKKQKKVKGPNVFKTRRGEQMVQDEEGKYKKVAYKIPNGQPTSDDDEPGQSLVTTSLLAAQAQEGPKYPVIEAKAPVVEVPETDEVPLAGGAGTSFGGGPMSFQPLAPSAVTNTVPQSSTDYSGAPVSFGGDAFGAGPSGNTGNTMTTQNQNPPDMSFRFRNSINQPDTNNNNNGQDAYATTGLSEFGSPQNANKLDVVDEEN